MNGNLGDCEHFKKQLINRLEGRAAIFPHFPFTVLCFRAPRCRQTSLMKATSISVNFFSILFYFFNFPSPHLRLSRASPRPLITTYFVAFLMLSLTVTDM